VHYTARTALIVEKPAFTKEKQDYAARLRLSSERLAELFETAFMHVT